MNPAFKVIFDNLFAIDELIKEKRINIPNKVINLKKKILSEKDFFERNNIELYLAYKVYRYRPRKKKEMFLGYFLIRDVSEGGSGFLGHTLIPIDDLDDELKSSSEDIYSKHSERDKNIEKIVNTICSFVFKFIDFLKESGF